MSRQYDEIKQLLKELVDWFGSNQRNLPWRKTYKPYHVWISEIMLQQTQMERGVVYFNNWLELFPDINSIAGAREQDILKAWEGLGYYSRARNIKKAAIQMVEEYGGQLPETYEELLSLPGIGPYTAAAIMSIAFNKPFPVLDANVERVMSRVLDISSPIKKKDVQEKIKKYVAQLVEKSQPRDVNQGLMELGALVCKPKEPQCEHCPLATQCRALSAGTVHLRPVKSKQPKTIDIVMACTIIRQHENFFIQQRHEDDVWGGLWEFPGGRLKEGESAQDAAIRELYEETEMKINDLEPFETVTHYYTRYRVTLHSFLGTIENGVKPKLLAAQQCKWVPLKGLSEYAFPSGHRQLIAKLRDVVNVS